MVPPRKKTRGLWSLEQLQSAMAAVKGGILSQRAAAVQYSVPRRTLVNHLKSGKVEKQIGRRTVLTKEQEDDLVVRIMRLASVGFPLTPKVLRRQAYVFCEQNNIENKFNKITKRAGKDWLNLFLKRHPILSKRRVQILNPGRAQKLNRPIVKQHFEEYKKMYEELQIRDHPQRLYNMDEKGCRLTIHNQPTVLAQKGSKRVHMVAAEHAENVTVAICVNALGNAVPPLVIFKGKRLKPEFTDNLPAGSLVKMAAKGSMTTSLFIDFIHHLGKYKTPGKCLLVFDGAACHLDYKIVDAADQENIVLYCLPSNTTHELQPLDKSVNKSFEHHWDEEVISFRYKHPEKNLTKARFNCIFSKVWSKCMSHDNIVNGFKATGLYPFDPDAIPIEAYAPSVLTERPTEQDPCIAQSPPASPLAGPSGISDRYVHQSSDTDETLFEDRNSGSPSLLHEYNSSHTVLDTGINRPIVDYSSTDSESAHPTLSNEPSTSGITVRRPVIYSSDSDISIDGNLIPLQRRQSQFALNIYSSSEDENMSPLSKQQRTPKKPVDTASYVNIDAIRQLYSSTSEDNEDDIPLDRLKTKATQKTPFQQLIPTPNFAVSKQKPRRKAINYKGTVVTKDSFTEKHNTGIQEKKQTGEIKRKQQKKKVQKNHIQNQVMLKR